MKLFHLSEQFLKGFSFREKEASNASFFKQIFKLLQMDFFSAFVKTWIKIEHLGSKWKLCLDHSCNICLVVCVEYLKKSTGIYKTT